MTGAHLVFPKHVKDRSPSSLVPPDRFHFYWNKDLFISLGQVVTTNERIKVPNIIPINFIIYHHLTEFFDQKNCANPLLFKPPVYISEISLVGTTFELQHQTCPALKASLVAARAAAIDTLQRQKTKGRANQE